jgi:hypothetical protein
MEKIVLEAMVVETTASILASIPKPLDEAMIKRVAQAGWELYRVIQETQTDAAPIKKEVNYI